MGVTGGKVFRGQLRALSTPGGISRLSKAVEQSGEDIAADAHVSITTNGAFGKSHVVSKPGDPPNADTQTLARAIKSELVSGEPLHAEVSSNAPYSAALEWGTSKMLARPFMAPAAAKNRQPTADRIARAINEIISKGA